MAEKNPPQTLPVVRVETPDLVSVVIPTRNGAAYLGQALASVAAQSYRLWEVIVVEDGSDDGAKQIVGGFAARHPNRRVEYFRNETSYGAAYTRNLAFTQTAGQFVALLDCDDRWMPHHLGSCVGALKASGDDLAYSTVVTFSDGSEHITGEWGPTAEEVRHFPQSLFGRSFVTPSATVVRRAALIDVGAWESRYRYCEDVNFFMRAAALGKRFRHIDGVHCLYRKNHAGATTQKLAGTIEEAGTIAQRYIGMAGTRKGLAKRSVAETFSLAAKMHLTVDPSVDPSVKRSRAAGLYLRAWRLRPKRVKYLAKALGCILRYGFSPAAAPLRRPRLPAEIPSPAVQRLAA